MFVASSSLASGTMGASPNGMALPWLGRIIGVRLPARPPNGAGLRVSGESSQDSRHGVRLSAAPPAIHGYYANNSLCIQDIVFSVADWRNQGRRMGLRIPGSNSILRKSSNLLSATLNTCQQNGFHSVNGSTSECGSDSFRSNRNEVPIKSSSKELF